MIQQTTLEASRYITSGHGQPRIEDDPEWGAVDVYDGRVGVLNDHAFRAAQLPNVRLVTGTLATYVVDDEAGGIAYPVLCGDIIEVRTLDEITDGRCGALGVDPDTLQCEGHAAERRAYMALTEAERAHMERMEDALYR